jgi:Ca2+-binding EF-hand superfamily protein
MKTAHVALATMVLAATVSAGNAQPASGISFGQGPMARLDTDKDGEITREEAETARKHFFARLDRNGDGSIDGAEIETARQAIADRATMMEARLSARWRRMDKDGDGKVSTAEFQSRPVIFELADRDGDGVVTEDEIDFMRGLFGRAG